MLVQRAIGRAEGHLAQETKVVVGHVTVERNLRLGPTVARSTDDAMITLKLHCWQRCRCERSRRHLVQLLSSPSAADGAREKSQDFETSQYTRRESLFGHDPNQSLLQPAASRLRGRRETKHEIRQVWQDPLMPIGLRSILLRWRVVSRSSH